MSATVDPGWTRPGLPPVVRALIELCGLTPRQAETLEAVCRRGMRDGAADVGICQHTAKQTLSAAYKKLGLAGPGNRIGPACWRVGRVYERVGGNGR